MTSLDDEIIQTYKEEIWIIANRPIADAMVYQGSRFEIHRLRYASLGERSRHLYEQAILALCREADRERSLVGLLLCGELVDYKLAPPNWSERAGSVVELLIKERGLALEDPTSRYLMIEARQFAVKSAIPAMREYVHRVTEKLKSGKIETRDWHIAIEPAIRGLIHLAPEIAWEELQRFLSDPSLYGLLKERMLSVLKMWALYGMEKYGIQWGRQFIEVMKSAPSGIRHWGIDTLKESLDSLEHWSGIKPPTRAERDELLELARQELGNDS